MRCAPAAPLLPVRAPHRSSFDLGCKGDQCSGLLMNFEEFPALFIIIIIIFKIYFIFGCVGSSLPRAGFL